MIIKSPPSNLASNNQPLSTDTELIALGYLPIQESLSILQDKPDLQRELVRIYYQTPRDFNYLVHIHRPDLVLELLGKNVATVNISSIADFETLTLAFSKFKGLENLSISFSVGFSSSYEDFDILVGFIVTRLESLEIKNDAAVYSFLRLLLAMKSLISLRSLKITKAVFRKDLIDLLVEFLKENNTLTSLSLESESYYYFDPIVNTLKENSTLTSLRLNTPYSYVYSLTAVANMLKVNKILTQLYLEPVHIRGKDLIEMAAALRENTTLKTLAILYSYREENAINVFSEALKENKSLTELIIAINFPEENPQVETNFIDSIGNHMTKLDLSGSELTDAGALALADKIKLNQLKSLSIANSKIGNASINLIDALFPNTSLVEFQFSNDVMFFGLDELVAWSNVLLYNKTLKSLTIRDIGFMDWDATCILFECLRHNMTLTSLDLEGAHIGDDPKIFSAFLDVIKYNKDLTKLNLTDNHIDTKEKLDLVLDALNQNRTLVELDLSRNGLSEETKEELKYNSRIKLRTRNN